MYCRYMKQLEWIAEMTKPFLRVNILYDSLYKLPLKRQTYIDRKTDQWLPGARDCGNVWLQMYSTRDLGGVGGDRSALYPDCGGSDMNLYMC